MCIIRRHFLAWEDIAGGSDLSAGEHFFREMQRPFWWVPAARWRNHYLACNKEAFPCVRPWTQLSASARTVHFRCMSVGGHVYRSAPSTSKVVDDGEAPDSKEHKMGDAGVE